MKTICVAVLDDGVGKDILYGMSSNIIWRDSIEDNTMVDIPSHGSRVIATIEKYNASLKQYLIYNIFQKGNSAERLVKVLQELLYESVDVIVMSLHVSNRKVYKELKTICNKLHKKGVILIASDTNHQREPAMPASLSNVVGVGGVSLEDIELLWKENSEIQVYASVLPEFVQIGKRFFLFSGTSKANGIVAAEVIRLLERGIYEYEAILQELKKRCGEEQTVWPQSGSICVDVTLHEEVLELLVQRGIISHDERGEVYLPKYALNIDELGKIVEAIFRNYHREEQILQLKYSDFKTTYGIVRFLEKRDE